MSRFALGLALFVVSINAAFAAPVVLHRGNVAEPETLDPQRYQTSYTGYILDDLFMGLTTMDARGLPIPGAAEKWTVTPDGSIYTFKLRPGLVWSDGMKMTADDFVFGIRRALDPKSAAPFANIAMMIKNAAAVNAGKLKLDQLGVRAIDAQTVEIALEKPAPVLLLVLAQPFLAPAPQHAMAKFGSDWTKPGKLVSNGPYVAVEWRANDHVKLIKNPRFYDAANVQIDEVYFYPTADDAAALKRFRAGELDANGRYSPSDYPWLKAHMPDAARIAPASWYTCIEFNYRHKQWQDVRVRRALALAIDREGLTDRLLKTGELPGYGIVPPVVPGYTGATLDFKGKPMADRQAEARRLLTAAGYSETHPLTFVFRHRAGTSNRRVAIALAQMWSSIGVKAELQQDDTAIHYAALRAGDFEVADRGPSWFTDPEYFLDGYLTDSSGNYASYSNATFDKLMSEAKLTADPARRLAAFAKAEGEILRDVATAPLFFNVNTDLVAPYVKGFEPSATGDHPTRFLRIDRASAAPR
jgi:oligopeptide transport system substrate-binding protein